MYKKIPVPAHYWDSPNSLRALKAVAKATSSGVLFINAAIISTIAGKLHGSLRWKVQYRCRYTRDLSVMPFFTCGGSFEALVFGYMNGLSDSTSNLFKDSVPSSNSFLTPVSDLSWKVKLFGFSETIYYNLNLN